MATNSTTLTLPLMVEILEGLRMHHVLECKFEKRMREVQSSTQGWNSRGILAPYTTELDYNHFGMSTEGGAIQGGNNLAYQRLKRTMRSIWKSVPITGELSRIQSEQFAAVKEMYGNDIQDSNILGQLASNRAIEIILKNASAVYGRLKNFYALNGTDRSTIATVTSAPSTSGNGATECGFSWSTSDLGNRFLKKGMKVQFARGATLRSSPAAATDYTAAQSASQGSSTITGVVSTSAAANASNGGRVTFDVLPSVGGGVAINDTVHIIQGFGAMPQGVAHWTDNTQTLVTDTGTVARTVAPEVFLCTLQDNSASTANTPKLMIEMESMIMGRTSDNDPINMEIWMNKAQVVNYQLFGLNAASVAYGTASTTGFNVQRNADFTTPGAPNVGIPGKGLSFNNLRINEDVDVPPSKNLWIDFLGWCVDEQTPTTLYEYHQNQQFYQSQNSYGEPLDAKTVTMFSQYNYGCTRFSTQGVQDDLAFNAGMIAQA